jgi:hypothetical protein
MRQVAAGLVLASLMLGCGPHRISFEMTSLRDRPGYPVQRMHSHGIGPLLVGGGAYFFLVDEISPALIDYTGPVDARKVCPNGFSSVEHYRRFWQNAAAAGLSYLVLVNAWHPSMVRWTCLGTPPAPRDQTAAAPTAPEDARTAGRAADAP